MCRKAQGAAFRTRASVKAKDFDFLSGESLLSFYESSPGERRSFCNNFGSAIIPRFDKYPDLFAFALGSLDSDPKIRIERHIFTKYKAPWLEIIDDLPQISDPNDDTSEGANN